MNTSEEHAQETEPISKKYIRNKFCFPRTPLRSTHFSCIFVIIYDAINYHSNLLSIVIYIEIYIIELKQPVILLSYTVTM